MKMFSSCLKKFQVQDGFNDEDVVEQSRNHQKWGLGFYAHRDFDSVLYSIGKQTRWLVPAILREKNSEDYEGENDYKVVLVERVSVNYDSRHCCNYSERLK